MASEALTTSAPHVGRVVEGFRSLKVAALLQIVAWILGIASIVSLFGALLGGALLKPEALLAGGLASVVLMLIVLILVIVSVYKYLLASAKSFAEWKPEEFSTPRKLLKVGLLYGAIITLVGLLVLAGGIASMQLPPLLAGGAIALVGGILFLIGWIGYIIFLLRLRGAFKSTILLVAAILAILSIVLGGVLNFIAWILTYIEASSLEKKVASGTIQV